MNKEEIELKIRKIEEKNKQVKIVKITWLGIEGEDKLVLIKIKYIIKNKEGFLFFTAKDVEKIKDQEITKIFEKVLENLNGDTGPLL